MEYYGVHLATEKLDIATLKWPRYDTLWPSASLKRPDNDLDNQQEEGEGTRKEHKIIQRVGGVWRWGVVMVEYVRDKNEK